MAEAHVVFALREKRARLAGELDRAQILIIRLKNEIASVDCCLKMFKPDYDPKDIMPKVTFSKGPAGLHKGVGSRTALEILRETRRPMSSQELAAGVLQRHERPLERKSLDMLVKTIHGNFSRRKDGIVEFDRGTYPGKWRLAAHQASEPDLPK